MKRLVPGAPLRYPSWGRIRTRTNIARSNYHGMTVGVNKRYSDGWQFQASYTLGNSNDTWSGGQIGGSDFDNGAGSASDWCDPEYEYGPSNYDVRHNFVFNAVYQLPFGQNRTGLAGVLAKGWNIGARVPGQRAACRSRRSCPTTRSAIGRATPDCRSRTSTAR